MYNLLMARGWESKSIEQQIEDSRTEPDHPTIANSSEGAVEPELRRQIEGLLFQRSRILQELQSARNQRYRQMLEELLRHLDSRLASK